uniref:Uncharacterized protein n=1 Tax=Candidatus Kentrum sp. FM TaxID=2126340 RepID=A0A450WLK5_9GAMM|nr:MAG: hypothetical protein BECKFM1743C_GA0114222_1003713 [Candidatus Kentron sp. FM]VFJ69962.1 MAG: hypothetical protein BECKFM1743A_GA0114220_105284 [Candidatus Kentron sp. FM]VFK17878.1 MAG: hypothetical protein BECKFM1743B_GA0114221_105094 [Candidatus Kentron sp. FM]
MGTKVQGVNEVKDLTVNRREDFISLGEVLTEITTQYDVSNGEAAKMLNFSLWEGNENPLHAGAEFLSGLFGRSIKPQLCTNDHTHGVRRRVNEKDKKEASNTLKQVIEYQSIQSNGIPEYAKSNLEYYGFKPQEILPFLMKSKTNAGEELKKQELLVGSSSDDQLKKLQAEIEQLQAQKERLKEEIEKLTTEQNNLPETERKSLLKMVLVMAISKYGYSPGSDRNKATGEKAGSICADFSNYGLKIDPDTVRKFIKEAEEQFEVHVPTQAR